MPPGEDVDMCSFHTHASLVLRSSNSASVFQKTILRSSSASRKEKNVRQPVITRVSNFLSQWPDLDIGCCVGQDIRKLVFDGAPSENMYGSDLEKNFMDIGYELFLDKTTLKTTFIPADVFDEESGLKQIEGEINIVHGASFLHLFDEEGQQKACKRIVKILKSEPGSLFIGRQIGNVDSGVAVGTLQKSKQRFRHNPESFKDLWRKVGEETSTKWEVHASLEDQDLQKLAAKMGIEAAFLPSGSRWLSFGVRRVA